MRRLTLPRHLRALRRDDTGGVTMIVTLVLAFGVLVGASALVVDAGRLYVEREELQSGADAAAVALAQECVRGAAPCLAKRATVGRYADRNARDGAAAVELVCGRGSGLSPCPPARGNLTDCVTAPPAGDYVEVRTATRLPDGSTVLPPTFAQAMLGNDGYSGATVGACARAAWGPPRAGTGIGVTLSICEWREATRDGTVFGAPPAGRESVFHLHDSQSSAPPPDGGCAPDQGTGSGGDNPGAFGWLSANAGPCEARVDNNGIYYTDPGNSAPAGCSAKLATARTERRVLMLPIYADVAGTGTNTRYHLSGFAAFVVTGYKIGGTDDQPSTITGQRYCSGQERCLYGYFVRELIRSPGRIGGPSYGAAVVNLVG